MCLAYSLKRKRYNTILSSPTGEPEGKGEKWLGSGLWEQVKLPLREQKESDEYLPRLTP